MRLNLGSPVKCADGAFGELADVVIDPSTRRVTHLVVKPDDARGRERLVPVELARSQTGADSSVSLDCTVAEIQQLETVHETAYVRVGELPVDDPEWDVGIQEVLASPFVHGLAPDGLTAEPVYADLHVTLSYDRVPKGEVEIRRASPVSSSDGEHLGHVDGFLVDDEGTITHLVLEHGHLWGKREIAIPIGAVTRVENDAVELTLSKDDVGAIPPLRVHR